jgi:two-component system OmpR family sensor kinase
LWLRGRSLRARLTALLVTSLAVICLIVGVVTTQALHAFLVGRLDEEVRTAHERAAAFAGPPPGDLPPEGGPAPEDGPANPGQARGLAPGTITALIVDGQLVRPSRQSEAAEPEPLPAELGELLLELPVDGEVHTRDLGELGAYRLTAAPSRAGDVVITGLPLAGVSETRLRVGLTLAAVSLVGLLVTALVGALLVRRTLRPLERVAETASQVTTLTLDRGEVALPVRAPGADPGTEVGRVAAALNRMLGHVGDALAARQASESRVRRFVADASHELRTPLASIRGYTELAGRYGGSVPAEVRHALGRVEAESTRMTTLVEELLLLAKLDSRRPVAREPVDLSRLVADAVADAHVAGPDHRWLLAAPAEPIVVRGDADQLHQSLINLLANARTHTPAGTTVRTELSEQDSLARLAVTDDGPGIPAEVLPEVFERFARADTSRSRAAGSTGLGLAIVAAVIAAHGGEVGVTSRPGHTEFTVTLPRATPSPGPPAASATHPGPPPGS